MSKWVPEGQTSRENNLLMWKQMHGRSAVLNSTDRQFQVSSQATLQQHLYAVFRYVGLCLHLVFKAHGN